MLDLSAERINIHAPYKVERVEVNTFLFTTKSGVVYYVGFSHDFSFMEENLYQFFITNVEHKHAPADSAIYETIKVVIEEFFEQGQNVILYICDSMDNRQAMRDRLFRIWFNTCFENKNITLYNEQIEIDDTWYFAGIMLRKDNPSHNRIIGQFHDFVQDIPNKWELL